MVGLNHYYRRWVNPDRVNPDQNLCLLQDVTFCGVARLYLTG